MFFGKVAGLPVHEVDNNHNFSPDSASYPQYAQVYAQASTPVNPGGSAIHQKTTAFANEVLSCAKAVFG